MWRLTRQHLVEHTAQGVDVAARIHAVLAHRLLRAHVARRSHPQSGSSKALGTEIRNRPSHPEVGQQGVASGEENVAGLYVAVDDTHPVRVIQRVRHLASNRQGLGYRELLLCGESLSQGLTLDEGHHIVEKTTRFTRIEDWQNVGMLQVGSDLDFPHEPLWSDCGRQRAMEDLDRNLSVMLAVDREVNSGHSAVPQFALDWVDRGERALEGPIVIYHCVNMTDSNPIRERRPSSIHDRSAAGSLEASACPSLRSDLLFVAIDGEGVAAASDRFETVLLGSLYAELLPILDGTRTVAEIRGELSERFASLSVRLALRKLRLLGCLAEDDPVRDGEIGQASTSPAAGTVPRKSGETREPSSATVHAVGRIEAQTWVAALHRRGLRVAPSSDLQLVLTDSYLRPELARLALEFSNRGTRWLLSRPIGSEIWVGPVFDGHQIDCWRCLQRRLERNRPVEVFLLAHTGESPASRHAPNLELGTEILAAALGSATSGGRNSLVGTLVAHDCRTGSSTPHRLTRCSACLPVKSEGHDRERHEDHSPIQSGTELERLLSAITGIATACETVDSSMPSGFYAAEATFGGRPIGQSLAALHRSRRVARGKGWTEAEARTSALGEAVERYSAVFLGSEPRVRASLEELGDEALHPNTCLLVSDRQFDGRTEWNLRQRRYNRVPRPFDPREPMEWSPVHSVSSSRQLYLPTAYLYDDYPQLEGAEYCWYDPTGTAAAPTREAAKLSSLLELVERDAIAIWWYNRIRRPQVEYDSVGDRTRSDIDRMYASAGREHWVLDLTTDLRIPVVAAVSRRTDLPTERPLFGFGCHLDPEVALSTAIKELNQVITLVRGDERGPRGVGVKMESWLRTASVDEHQYLAPAPDAAIHLEELPRRVGSSDPHDDLGRLYRTMAEAGLEPFELDLTRPDVGVTVTRMIIPGCRPFYARFAPGRLYDVPVDMKWLPNPTPEGILNPVPFLL